MQKIASRWNTSRCDRILHFFLCPEIRQLFPHFGAIPLPNYTESPGRKRMKIHTGENARKSTTSADIYTNCSFLSLVVVERVLNQHGKGFSLSRTLILFEKTEKMYEKARTSSQRGTWKRYPYKIFAWPCLQVLVVKNKVWNCVWDRDGNCGCKGVKKCRWTIFRRLNRALKFRGRFGAFFKIFVSLPVPFSFWNSKLFGPISFCRGAALTKCGFCNAKPATRRQSAARMTFWAPNTWKRGGTATWRNVE